MKIAFVSTAIVLVGLLGNVVVADAQNTCPDCIAAGCVACGGMNSPAYAMNYGHCGPRCQASLAYPWNCGYYYTQWGSPVALVVPPTAERQYSMGWGVGNTRLTRIYQQFGRPYPGNAVVSPGRRFWPPPIGQVTRPSLGSITREDPGRP